MRKRFEGLDIARWTIYGLLSILTIVIGALLLASQQSDAGISLVTAGVTSLLFLTQKVVDDIASAEQLRNSHNAIKLLEEHLTSTLSPQRLEEAIGATYAALGAGADTRVTFSRHLASETLTAVKKVEPSGSVEIDAIGISLQQMMHDLGQVMLARRRIGVRMIVLDPTCDDFDRQVRHEGRDPSVMRAQIQNVRNLVSEINRSRVEKGLQECVELRMLDSVMTVTGIRINGCWHFRPRLADESNSFQFFFERYDSSAPKCVAVISGHFEALWREAQPSKTDPSAGGD